MSEALRLARQAGSRLAAARALAGLSHQAIYLGRLRQAIDYVDGSRVAIQHAASPRAIAMTAAMQKRHGTP